MSSASCVCTSFPSFGFLTARAPSYVRPTRATPTPAVAAVFIFLTVIQSETCAPICFSGHHFYKHGIASRRERSLALGVNLEAVFESMDLLLALQSWVRPTSDAHVSVADGWRRLCVRKRQSTTLLFTPNCGGRVSAREDCN